MGIYEMLGKNSPVKIKLEKENQTAFEKLVDKNKELVDENKYLKHKIERTNKYIKEGLVSIEYINVDAVLMTIFSLLNDNSIELEEKLGIRKWLNGINL